MDVQHLNGLADRLDLGVGGDVPGQEDAVLAGRDDLAVPGDHGSERAAPVVVDRLLGQPARLLHQLVGRHRGGLVSGAATKLNPSGSLIEASSHSAALQAIRFEISPPAELPAEPDA